jgi:hypothetical protein
VTNPRSIVVGTATCPPVCGRVDSEATIPSAAAASKRATRLVIGRDRTRVAAAQTRKLTLTLTRAGRRALHRHQHRLATRLSVHVNGPGPADATATHGLTLRTRAS